MSKARAQESVSPLAELRFPRRDSDLAGQRRRDRTIRSPVLVPGLVLVLALSVAASARGGDHKIHVDPSKWWPELEKVEETARAGRYKAARRTLDRLTEDVLGSSWFGPDLRKILARLAFLDAVARANLGQDREAIWTWHMACNLDFKLRQEDFGPWGKAGDLLLEHPLRRRGQVPIIFDQPVSAPGRARTSPQWPRSPVTPTILNNTGAAQEHQGDFEVELIIDQDGRPHQPVVISTHIHPVVTYATLRAILTMKPFTPGSAEGEIRDMVTVVRVRYFVERW